MEILVLPEKWKRSTHYAVGLEGDGGLRIMGGSKLECDTCVRVLGDGYKTLTRAELQQYVEIR